MTVIQEIETGEYDDDLGSIIEAIAQRRRVLNHRKFDAFATGDRVRVSTEFIKPKYLDGAKATVVEKRISKITIQFDKDINDPYGKWAGKRCTLSPEHLVKEEAAA